MNKSAIQRLLLIAVDIFSLYLSVALTAWLLDWVRPGAQDYFNLNIIGTAKLLGLSIILVFWYQEHYTKRRPLWEEVYLLCVTITLFAILHLGLTYLLAHHVIKLFNVVFWLFLLLLLPLLRYIARKLMLQLNLWQRDVYIIGVGATAAATVGLFNNHPLLGYRVRALVALNSTHEVAVSIENNLKDLNLNGIPVMSYADLIGLKLASYTEVVFALPLAELLANVEKINLLQSKFPFVSIVPDITGLPLYGVELDHFFGSEEIILRLRNNLGRRVNRIIKRISDIIFSVLLLIITSPIFLAVSLGIKLTNGTNLFFKHRRIGINGQEFNCLKFQTMHTNNEQMLQEYLLANPEAKLEWERDFKLRNDPRVTWVGKFLRKTSLDELPQLVNVLIGDMSLVGPRPIVAEEMRRYADDIYYYKLVRPGITGLWQVSGRNDVDYINRVRLDTWYVKNWSLWYDFVILLKTITVVFSKKGAY
jgi:undecaprenyl-phosphate galactose phosphotransferase